MMHTLLALATTCAVTLHALLGCCMHHEHAAGQDVVSSSQPVEVARCGHHHAHDEAENSDEPQGHEHPADDPCEESDCQFVFTLRCDDVTFALSPAQGVPTPGALGGDATLLSVPGESTLRAHRSSERSATVPLRVQTAVWLL